VASYELIVEWPDGRRSRVPDVRPNRLYEIDQAAATETPPEASPAVPPESAAVDPHFVDVSSMLDHRHVDAPFDDALRQPLLPNRLSQLGPGVTWLDADGDGDPDLFVGAGRGGRLAWFRNDDGELVRNAGFAEARFDQTTVLGLPATGSRQGSGDAGDDSAPRQDLLIGQTSYEASSPAEALEAPSVLLSRFRVSRRVPAVSFDPTMAQAVPGDRSATGPLAQADVDGDGDLDLFVGGRVIPVAYPIAASSRLLLNRGGSFQVDSAYSAPLAGIGLVSGAVFSDLDMDGDPDLILAMEWGPIRVLRNEDGAFTDVTEELGLAEAVGRWNGITTGDLNADGQPDIVATGWGRNTEHAEHDDRYRLFYGDLDRNGTLDMVEAVAVEGGGGWRPLHRLDYLARGLPFLQGRQGGHAAYSMASLRDLFDEALDRAGELEARILEHTLFLNRGTRFESVALPPEAQLAPASHVGVADLDGDGWEDVFLAQNFFPVRPGTPRYDAGRGLWLRGDGSGGLNAVPGRESGIEVYGDARGAAFADYDRDGRVDLVVSQNGEATKLFRNTGATPGLRVRLEGPPGNPQAIGAILQLVYEDGLGPAREVRSGAGYWSRDEAVQTLGMRTPPTAVRVRWPDGEVGEIPVDSTDREVRLRLRDR
jgi:hypothetical protein